MGFCSGSSGLKGEKKEGKEARKERKKEGERGRKEGKEEERKGNGREENSRRKAEPMEEKESHFLAESQFSADSSPPKAQNSCAFTLGLLPLTS